MTLKGLVAVLSLFLFYVMERVLVIHTERKRKQKKVNSFFKPFPSFFISDTSGLSSDCLEHLNIKTLYIGEIATRSSQT